MGTRASFKKYEQHQPTFLPPSLEELIPANHLVRTVNRTIEEMDLSSLVRSYPGGGSSSYHPEMMLKVIAYGYTQRLYSSRQIAKGLRENINLRWLSGGNTPDFRTINRFRSSRLKGALNEVFTSLIEILTEAKLVKLEDYFLDGTKIEANANKYSFVWKKSVVKHKTGVRKKVRELLDQIDEVEREENERYGDRDLEEVGEESEVTSELIRRKVEELNKRLKELEQVKEPGSRGGKSKKARALTKVKKVLEEDCLPRLERYQKYEAQLGSRNSMSKIDTDATFMRMKEDPMRNGQLKPGYNVQIGTERRYILDYSIHQRPTDTTTLPVHLAQVKEQRGVLPNRVVADAGYGSEANYEYMKSEGIEAYVKYNQYDAQKKRSRRKDPFRTENLPYDAQQDQYTCPSGVALRYIGQENSVSETGYRSQRRLYEADNCEGCALREQCHRSQYNRRIRVSHQLMELQAKARERLDSPLGQILRRQRRTDVETVFAQIKHNRGFRRFLLRTRDKVHIEYGLVSLAHNLINLHNDPQRNSSPN